MKIGDFEIFSFVEQNFKLDGGSMFGVIPKSLWQRSIPADENNLINMVNNIFVLKAHGRIMLFDIGLGDTLSELEKKIYACDGNSNLESALSSFDIKPDDVDFVILTHLHTDHSGGAVKLIDGDYIPRFDNARYIISKEEWDVAINPNERTGAVYIPERFHALNDAGKIDFIERDTELFDGIKTIHTGGHTEGHFAIDIQSGNDRLIYFADIFPTSAHIKVPFVPATDLFPLDSMTAKRKAYPDIIDTNTILAFDHDVNMPFAKVKKDGKKFICEPVTDKVATA